MKRVPRIDGIYINEASMETETESIFVTFEYFPGFSVTDEIESRQGDYSYMTDRDRTKGHLTALEIVNYPEALKTGFADCPEDIVEYGGKTMSLREALLANTKENK